MLEQHHARKKVVYFDLQRKYKNIIEPKKERACPMSHLMKLFKLIKSIQCIYKKHAKYDIIKNTNLSFIMKNKNLKIFLIFCDINQSIHKINLQKIESQKSEKRINMVVYHSIYAFTQYKMQLYMQ